MTPAAAGARRRRLQRQLSAPLPSCPELVPLAVDPIERRWRGLQQRLEPLLLGQPGLSAQPISVDRHLAYDYDPERFDHRLIPRLEVEGVDCLHSGGRCDGIVEGLHHFGFAHLFE